MSEPRPESQPAQQQTPPGVLGEMTPKPDHGEESYRGSGQLDRQGGGHHRRRQRHRPGRGDRLRPRGRRRPDLLPERARRRAGHRAGTSRRPAGSACWSPATSPTGRTAKTIIPKAVEEFGRIDVLVNNAAFQMSHETLEEISDEEWDHTFATNLTAMFLLCKAAVPHMQPGASIINSLVGELRHARARTWRPTR